MNQTPSKKRVIIYIIIFATLAFAIVFFAQKKSTNESYSIGASRADNINFEMEHIMPIPEPMLDADYSTSTTMPEMAAKSIQPTSPVENSTDQTIIQSPDKRVIKTGTIDMRVNSVEKAISEIRAIAQTHGGNEMSSDFSKNGTYKNGYIIIKVPVNQYVETFEQIKRIAPLVTHESSQAQDVTAQFIDLESRLKNKKEHEDRLRTFFDKADNVTELIQVERELARVRTEVEQMEGQLKYLKDQTQYSTIHTSLMEDSNIVVSDSWRPLQVMKDSFNTLIEKSTTLLNTVIRFTITSLPFIILFIIIAWFLYFTAKHIFKKDNNNKEKNNQ